MSRRKKPEFSKLLVFSSAVIFVINLALGYIFSWLGKDTSLFAYSIPITGGVLGSAVVFYLNKAKTENVCKGKIKFLEYKLKKLDKHPDKQEVIEEELASIENALNEKIDSEIAEAVSESVEIQQF